MMERTNGFQPVHCLRRNTEKPVFMLAVIREQKTVTDKNDVFVRESVTYKNAAGLYLGQGHWAFGGETGGIWNDHRSETVSKSSNAGEIIRSTQEVAAWCELEDSLTVRKLVGLRNHVA